MILGYGICGPNEKYIEYTLDTFQCLCDRVIIVMNNATEREYNAVKRRGFEMVVDDREWGKDQWKIKEDFVKKNIPALKPEWCICLDMDEEIANVREKSEFKSIAGDNIGIYMFFAYMWEDDEHYNPVFNLWNVRAWRPDERLSLDWERQSLHCWLVPKSYPSMSHRRPFIIKHYGLMTKTDRMGKIERYNKYDPRAIMKGRAYYDSLRIDSGGVLFDEDVMQREVEQFINKYPEKIREIIMQNNPNEKFYYVINPMGQVIDIPERHLNATLKRPGFKLVEEVERKASNMNTMPLPVKEPEKVEPVVEPTIEPTVEQNPVVAQQPVEEKVYDQPFDAEINTIDKPIVPVNPLECGVCGFVAKSDFGLRVHKRRHA